MANEYQSIEDVKEIKRLLDNGLLDDADEAALADIIDKMHDMAEDAITSLVYSIEDDESMVVAIKHNLEIYEQRKRNAEHRIKMKRMLIAQFMRQIKLDKFKTAGATVSIKDSLPQLELLDESEIPSKYIRFEEAEPKMVIDKKAIKKALQNGEEIKGARLFKYDTTIQIRRK